MHPQPSLLARSPACATPMPCTVQVHSHAFQIANDLGDGFAKINLLAAMGDLCRTQADYATAQDSYKTALSQAEVVDTSDLVANLCFRLGHLHLLKEEYEEAKNYFSRQLWLMSQMEASDNLCMASAGMGIALYGMGQNAEARRHFDKALGTARTLSNTVFMEIQRHLPHWCHVYERLLLAEGESLEALSVTEERHSVLYTRGLVWRTQKVSLLLALLLAVDSAFCILLRLRCHPVRFVCKRSCWQRLTC